MKKIVYESDRVILTGEKSKELYSILESKKFLFETCGGDLYTQIFLKISDEIRELLGITNVISLLPHNFNEVLVVIYPVPTIGEMVKASYDEKEDKCYLIVEE